MHASLPLRRHASPIWPPPARHPAALLAAAARRTQPPPTPTRARRRGGPVPARAGTAPRSGAGRTANGPSTDARSGPHASDATSTSTRQRSRITTSLTHLTTTSATLAIAHPRSPPTPASSPSPSPLWLPYLVLYFLILMLVLVPITLAAAPPPAYHLHAWASLPGVCLAGRGRGVQRVSAGPPFLERPGVKRNLSRRRGGGPLISQDQRQEINGHRSTGDRAHSALSPSRERSGPLHELRGCRAAGRA